MGQFFSLQENGIFPIITADTNLFLFLFTYSLSKECKEMFDINRVSRFFKYFILAYIMALKE
jgi:hypothetical protein